MGDRSPKDKMKQKKQHEVDAQKHHQQKQDNMVKNRKDQERLATRMTRSKRLVNSADSYTYFTYWRDL